ncbi:ImmA/IrrE family metallo-endopeptidase [Methylobacterium sp. WL6]|uniref:ImmA/IrrE family metallo-endopeptidase n=1 Tax=Methylobacterium sp. WL6 TaxID=2603901 RepID=UPI002484A8B5|nr:ImmA/IrrE family metallo-endopeptidase [Methylobacterium sp. WL6]
MFLPSITSVVRDRFTIAHELGHLFLHYPLATASNRGAVMVATRWVDEENQDLRRAEWEANWFAAAFLMPSQDFIKSYRSNLNSVEVTAVEFGVSSKAAGIRAQSLGL